MKTLWTSNKGLFAESDWLHAQLKSWNNPYIPLSIAWNEKQLREKWIKKVKCSAAVFLNSVRYILTNIYSSIAWILNTEHYYYQMKWIARSFGWSFFLLFRFFGSQLWYSETLLLWAVIIIIFIKRMSFHRLFGYSNFWYIWFCITIRHPNGLEYTRLEFYFYYFILYYLPSVHSGLFLSNVMLRSASVSFWDDLRGRSNVKMWAKWM